MANYDESEAILPENMSSFRKGHSTTTVLMGVQDDLICAMKKKRLP
jgi:hypothetical protein